MPHLSPNRSVPATVLGLALALAGCGDGSSSPGIYPPVAAFTPSCTGLSCTFTDGSSDPDGSIVSRSWEFGDGTSSTETSPTHAYAGPGVYLVKLTVTDNTGLTGTRSQSLTLGGAEKVLIGAGDIATCSSNDAATAAVIARYPDATVYTLGDNAYPNGSMSDYSGCYDPTWGQFKERTRPAPGNHEYNTAGAAGYFGYFGASAGPAGLGYYSYDLGDWHVISLNSEVDATETGAQAAWLRQDLADHPAICTLAYWHKPLFTSGAVHPPETTMRTLFTILYDASADVVLSGHNHQYERFALQAPDGSADAVGGIRVFVVGTGGAGLYDFATPQPNSEVRSKTFGVLKLTLGPTGYTWEFLPIAGASFTDSGAGTCH
jgi:acid phosphatase type 7